MRTYFPVAIALLFAVFMFGATAAAKDETSDVTPPSVLSVALDTYFIDTSEADAFITATLHLTDDLSGVSVVYLKMRPLEVLRIPAPEYQYSIGGSCTFEQDQLDAVCVIPMTVFRYAYEGEWAIESIIAEDRLRNNRNLYHPELPGEWNSETGEVTRYYCNMYGYECLPTHLNVTFMNAPPRTCAASSGAGNASVGLASCDPYKLMLPLLAKQ